MTKVQKSKIAIFETVIGQVIKGRGEGKKLGFPTMNLSPRAVPKTLAPGIYIVIAKTPVGTFHGVAHFGPRPAVKAGVSFEVHCFGLAQDLYGEKIEVTLYKKIREISDFPTLAALKKAIAEDVKVARVFFSKK